MFAALASVSSLLCLPTPLFDDGNEDFVFVMNDHWLWWMVKWPW